MVSYYYYSQNVKDRKMWCARSRMDNEILTFAEKVNLQVVIWQVQVENYVPGLA